jgi:flagellar motor switch protein FliG
VRVGVRERTAVLEDFVDRLHHPPVLSMGGRSFVEQLLTQMVGPRDAQEWLRRLDTPEGEPATPTDPFAPLATVPATVLWDLLQTEHPAVIAMVLAHLPDTLSAEILGLMPAPDRVTLLRRLALPDSVTPGIVTAVADSLLQRVHTLGAVAQGKPQGLEVVVGLLNRSSRAVERQVLKDLGQEDPELADAIQARMFLFEDLLTLEPRTLQVVLRRLSKRDLAMALKTAGPAQRAQYQAHMSHSAAEELQTELEEMGPVTVRDVELAQQRIVAVVRAMEEAEEIELTRGEDLIY